MDELFERTYQAEGSPTVPGINIAVGYQESYSEALMTNAKLAAKGTEIEITADIRSTIHIKLSPSEGFSDTKSEISSTKKLEVDLEIESTEFHKIPHDMVLWALTGIKPKVGNRDERIDNVWKFKDPSLKAGIRPTSYSPDYIKETNDYWGVCEIGTNMRNTLAYFTSKAEKYFYDLQARSLEKHTVFVVLVLGPNGYTTNIRGLDEDLLQSLVAHYYLGLRMVEKAKSLGWVSAADEKYKEVRSAFDHFHERINIEFQLPETANLPYIGQDTIKFWEKDEFDVKKEVIHYYKIVREAAYKSLGKKLQRADIEREAPLIAFKEKMMADNYRDYEKAPVQHPIVMPLFYENNTSDYYPRVFYNGMNKMGLLWNEAMDKGNYIKKQVQDPADTLRMLLQGIDFSQQFKEHRRQKNRVTLTIDLEMRKYLGKHGVLGRKVAAEYGVLEQYNESKKPFSWFVSVDDIDNFKSFTMFDLLKNFDGPQIMPNKSSEEIRAMGRSVWPNNNDNSNDFVNLFNTTKLARCLWFFDQVMQEVNLSVNQLCSQKQFVLKKVANLNAYLLIKPTTTEGKTNYSLMIQKSDFNVFGLPFKEGFDLGDWICFDFVSVDRHKLTHYLFSLEKTAMCFATWCDIYKVDPTTVLLNVEKYRDIVETFAINFLLFMESKGQTSYNFMLARYAYMEVTRGTLDKPEAFKIFNKLDPRPKSRLLVWYYKNLEIALKKMQESPVVMDFSWRDVSGDVQGEEYNDVRSNPVQNIAADRFKNLINFCTQREIPRFEIALNLSYLGSWHNKDEQEKVSGYLKIFNKVVSQERLMKDQREPWMGRERVKDVKELLSLKDHEFDQRFVRCIGRLAREHLSDKYGVDYRVKIRDDLMKAISNKTAESLATYKASSLMSGLVSYRELLEKRKSKLSEEKMKEKVLKKEEELKNVMDEYGLTADQILKSEEYAYLKTYIEQDVDVNDKKMINKRRKVMEGIIDLIQHEMKDTGYSQPLLVLDKIILQLKSEGGVFVNLFKKAQLGGVREIFVMTIRSRIAILYVELISRIISKELPHETQAKPQDKATRGDAYFNNINMKREKGEFTNESSSMGSYDQTTWCQKFVNPVFSALLSELLPAEMHHVTAVIHNLFTAKQLELPEELLDLFYEKSDIFGFDDDMNQLKKEWLGKEKGNLTSFLSIFLKNESNMMQGVQHFTSNILHACYCIMMHHFASLLHKEFIAKGYLMKETLADDYFEVSSDDSSMTLTLLWKELEEDTDAMKLKWRRSVSWYHHIMHEMKTVAYPLICSKDSPAKSTQCNLNLIKEFNSTWEIRNTKLSPVIKFSYSSLVLNVTSRMEDRQLNFSNARKQIVENGGSFLLSSICQELQARIHYKVLGADVQPYFFNYYQKELQKKPHPSLGFFIYESEFLCGTLGYDHAYYSSVMALKDMNKMEQAMLTREGAELNELGKPSVTVNLLIGQNINYNKFLNKLKIPENWKAGILNDPHCLFYNPRDEKDSLALIYKKALTPSSAQAFSFSTGSKLMSSSVYVLQTNCITVREREIIHSVPFTKDLSEEEIKKINESKNGDKTKEFKSKKISLIRLITDIKTEESLSKDMIDLLFPARYYYDQANSIIFKYKLATREPLMINRPCKAVTVIIPRMQRFCTIDLINVVQQRWFGQTNQGSKTDLERCWHEYRTLYPWLSETWQESVTRSPFKDVFSMADFVRSLSSGNGTFKVLGPIKRGLPFNMQIEQMIKLCFYKDKLLRVLKIDEAIEKASGVETRTLISELNSRLLISLTAPYTSEVSRKVEITKKIIQSESVLDGDRSKYISQMARMTDKELKLAVVQQFIKHAGPRYLKNIMKNQNKFTVIEPAKYSLTELIKTAKHGSFAFFNKEQEQNKDTGRWEGRGQITGVIDGMPFMADLFDDRLQKIYTYAPYQLANKTKELKKMMNGFNVFKNGVDFTKTQLSFDLVNGNLTSYKDGFVPIEEVPYMHAANIDDDRKYPKDYSVNADGSIVIRMQADRVAKRFCKIIDYVPSKFNFNLISDPYIPDSEIVTSAQKSAVMKDPVYVWTANQSLKVENFKMIMYELVKKLEDDNQIAKNGVQLDSNVVTSKIIQRMKSDDAEKLKAWLSATLLNRATHKGIKSSTEFITIVEESAPIVDESELNDFFMSSMAFDNDEPIDDVIEEMIDLGNVEFNPYDPEFTNEDVVNEIMSFSFIEGRQVEIINRRLEDITFLHPFWDDVIGDLFKAESHRNVADLIAGKFMVSYDDTKFGSTSFYVAWLMGNFKRSSITTQKNRTDFVPKQEEDEDVGEEYDIPEGKMEED